MAAAAMAPRVRTMVICDDVSASLTEHRVFTLEGVRFDLVTTNLPCRAPLNVFLLLSNPRKGTFPGQILLINERNDKLLRFVKFVAEFHGDNQMLPCCIDLGECAFPNDGLYRFEVSFSVLDADVLKGEHPFTLILDEG